MSDITVCLGDLVSVSVEIDDDVPLEVFETLLRRAGDEALRVHTALAATATTDD